MTQHDPAPSPAHGRGRGPARMPVSPLLMDLAGWGWRLLLLVTIAWLALRVAQSLHLVFFPLAGALLLKALLSPVTDGLQRRGMPRVAATAITVTGSLAILVGVLTWVIRRGVHEFPALLKELTRAIGQLPVRTDTVKQWQHQLVTEMQSHRGALTEGVLSGVLTGAQILTGLLLTVLLTVILLIDGANMWQWVVRRFPEPARPRLQEAARHAYSRMSGWIRGTFLIAIFHGVVVAITLLLLGVPLIAPLSILVFFGSFVPIVGSVIFGAVALLVAFASHGPAAAVVLAVVLLVDNQVEAHVLQPFLVGRYVEIHPFAVALAITAGAELAGLGGALLAVPITAAVYAALTHLEPPPATRPKPRALQRPLPRWTRARPPVKSPESANDLDQRPIG